MEYLVRLVTPPGGTVLEPFAGSGATIEAAISQGFQVIAIEQEWDYIRLIEARLNKPIQEAM
jgi:DNA modification methylase